MFLHTRRGYRCIKLKINTLFYCTLSNGLNLLKQTVLSFVLPLVSFTFVLIVLWCSIPNSFRLLAPIPDLYFGCGAHLPFRTYRPISESRSDIWPDYLNPPTTLRLGYSHNLFILTDSNPLVGFLTVLPSPDQFLSYLKDVFRLTFTAPLSVPDTLQKQDSDEIPSLSISCTRFRTYMKLWIVTAFKNYKTESLLYRWSVPSFLLLLPSMKTKERISERTSRLSVFIFLSVYTIYIFR